MNPFQRSIFLIFFSSLSSLLMAQTTLFYEDWQNDNVGDRANQLENWTMGFSGNAQVFTVQEYPGNPSKHVIAPDWPSEISNSVRRIFTKDLFSFDTKTESLTFETQVRLDGSGQYVRLILAEVTDGVTLPNSPYYYVDIYSTVLRLSASNPATELGAYSFQSGDLRFGELQTYKLVITPIGSSYQMTVYQDGIQRFSIVDEDPFLFENGLAVGIGLRNSVDAMLGDVTLSTAIVPEAKFMGLLFSSLLIIGLLSSAAKKRRMSA